jgi:DNA polymerase I-like protein with 3'-5' exonuclease and polymerase domains
MTFKTLILDVETTTFAKGNPFHKDNKLVTVGIIRNDNSPQVYLIYHEHISPISNNSLTTLKEYIEDADILVGHNIKFDLHWIRNLYPDIKFPNVWDTQLAEFIKTNQKSSMTSLDELSKTYSTPKAKGSLQEYWDAGINTDQIPLDPLFNYLVGDIINTKIIYTEQLNYFLANTKKFELLKLHNKDLLTLQEMEYNGLIFDDHTSQVLKQQTNSEIKSLDDVLKQLFPYDFINYNSSDHLSALLYGGCVKYITRENFTRTLKNGTIKTGDRAVVRSQFFPRLVEPKKGSEGVKTKKLRDDELQYENIKRIREKKPVLQRIYSTDQNILRSLRPKDKKAKAFIATLLKRSELSKLVETYYDGLPKIITKNGWKPNEIHGQFNQTIARTGRLSSSNPNEQNFSGQIKHLFKSRYE